MTKSSRAEGDEMNRSIAKQILQLPMVSDDTYNLNGTVVPIPDFAQDQSAADLLEQKMKSMYGAELTKTQVRDKGTVSNAVFENPITKDRGEAEIDHYGLPFAISKAAIRYYNKAGQPDPISRS